MMSQRWPLHPPPYLDESLSSWLERLAGSYGYRSDDLLRHDLGFPALSAEELDKNPPPLLLERLAERSGISVKQLGTMTIQGWVPHLIDHLEPDPDGYPAYMREHALLYPIALRPADTLHHWVPWISAHRFNESVACRLCLKESSEPYRRLCWRMAWMMSCPRHGILLEERIVIAGRFFSETDKEPIPAPAEILALDRFTKQAIESGMVPLPSGLVPGGSWLRLLRTLLDELSQPITLIVSYRPTLLKIWSALGLDIREGMRRATIPFEMLDSGRQFLLMRVAGVAVELLRKGELKKGGKDAQLFTVAPRDHEAPPPPLLDLQSEKKETRYEQAWGKACQAIAEVEAAMRYDLETAIQMRKQLLGSTPTPEKVERIDRFFRQQGYLLSDDVIE